MKNSTAKPWVELDTLLQTNRPAEIEEFLQQLDPSDLVRTIFRLNEEQQQNLLRSISTGTAAEMLEDLPEVQAAEMLDELPAEEAATIVTSMSSDDKVDLLTEMDEMHAEAILEAMDQEAAADARLLMRYEANVAGGLMQTEFISYVDDLTVDQVLKDMSSRHEEYSQFSAPFIYVTTSANKLLGVLRLRDLVFADRSSAITDLIATAESVLPEASIDELSDFFDHHEINAVPVVEPHTHTIIGIVRRKSISEKLSERSEAAHLRQAGIVGGEEFRSMPVAIRSRRRLSWLSINIVLNVIAASVIAMYQDTLSAVIALAVFLPIVSDMSGCSGNQAVAVSLRELSLGIVNAKDMFRVWRQEVVVGVINGLVLGALIAVVAITWQGNAWLGLVVGGALMLNTIVAVSIGGTVPLALRAFNIDPAIAAGPILTTVTDMCGFALVLGLATLALPLIT